MAISRHFFLSLLQRYIDQKNYDYKGQLPLDSELKKLRLSDLRKWPKVPRPWINSKECILIGIAHASIDVEKSFLYLNEAQSITSDKYWIETAKLSEALVLFKESIRPESPKISWLRLARRIFLDVNHPDVEISELALLYATLCYVADNQLEKAIETLSKAAKLRNNAQIYAMVCSFYRHQKMFKIAEFFNRRSKKYAKQQLNSAARPLLEAC